VKFYVRAFVGDNVITHKFWKYQIMEYGRQTSVACLRESTCRKDVMTKNRRNTETKGIKYKKGRKLWKRKSKRGNRMNKHGKASYMAATQ